MDLNWHRIPVYIGENALKERSAAKYKTFIYVEGKKHLTFSIYTFSD